MPPEAGFGWGLLVAALLLGLRHGIDWDHIAAISDISATQQSWRRGVVLGSIYAAGHAVVVFVIGSIAIVAGRSLPGWADELMGRLVGLTLLALAAYVIYSLVRDRGHFRPRSRWMVLLGGLRAAVRWVRRRPAQRVEGVVHDHTHAMAEDIHHDVGEEPKKVGDSFGTQLHAPRHRHPHRHEDLVTSYSVHTSLGVGMLHGVGAETPTQVLVFLAAASAGGIAAGLAVLAVFLVGLFAANTAITVMSALGFRSAGNRQKVFVALGVVTAAISLVLGVAMVAGQDSWLPALLAG